MHKVSSDIGVTHLDMFEAETFLKEEKGLIVQVDASELKPKKSMPKFHFCFYLQQPTENLHRQIFNNINHKLPWLITPNLGVTFPGCLTSVSEAAIGELQRQDRTQPWYWTRISGCERVAVFKKQNKKCHQILKTEQNRHIAYQKRLCPLDCKNE